MGMYDQEHQTHSDTIKSILRTRLDMYVQTLRHVKERELPPLPKKVLNQIEDSINQAIRTMQEIGGWTVPMEMTTSTASTFGLSSSIPNVPVMNCEDYAVVEVGRLCETIWEISRLVIFDGKLPPVVAIHSQPPQPQPSIYGSPFPNQPPGYVPPYTPPFAQSPFGRNW